MAKFVLILLMMFGSTTALGAIVGIPIGLLIFAAAIAVYQFFWMR